MRPIFVILLFTLIFSIPAYPQQKVKKELKALRITERPRIDGKLDDACWQGADEAKDWIEYEPYNGEAPTYQSSVKIVYDNFAIYVGAIMYDDEPDKIMRELGSRDAEELNADFFLVSFSPYNDGLNSFDFFLYASGVQVDVKTFSTGSDISWDAVWKSEVSITDEGWIAEIEIPFSALRFPKTQKQVWGLNFAREVRRLREISHWNFVNKKIDGILNQSGLLTGLENIRPPLRLSFEPYLSATTLKEPTEKDWDWKFNGGMDLKYGISESFTLDMTMIPDFSQVQSDDQVVNLGPFETYYSEKRQFFTEGVELFSKGNIFYSRRVGAKPMYYDSVADKYPAKDIIENPEQTRLINATKISGRTSKGTGIGVFNAMTAPSYATVRDSTGDTPEIQTQPFTNYSMAVVDQTLPNNSYVSLYNTNVYRGRYEYTANVSGTEMSFRDKKNRISATGLFNLSQKYFPGDSSDLGFLYQVGIGKIGGNANYGIYRETRSDKYDPNDLGFLENNNEIETGAYFVYNIYDPFWRILNMHNAIEIDYYQLYSPRDFAALEISFENRTEFKNILTVGLEGSISPVWRKDFFEPRHEGWFVKYPPSYSFRAFYSPDYNKTFMVDIMPAVSWTGHYNQYGYYLRLGPRYKINRHLFMVLTAFYQRLNNDIGYVTDSLDTDGLNIIFGKRDIDNVTVTLGIDYTINPKFIFSGRLRHYFYKADYNQYYDLQKDGDLDPNQYQGDNDFVYNAFNVDTYFTWWFAPGSQLILAWKNAIYTTKGLPSGNYFTELANTLGEPASDLISLKVLYYLDYQYLRALKKK